MSWRVPLISVELTDDDIEAYLDRLRSGWLTMGPSIAQFEAEFGAYVGTRHAVAVSSGTSALHLAYLAAGVRPGDEVIVPAMTFVATASAARYVGATPVFCDSLGPTRPEIDPEAVARQITPQTKVVAVTHLMGYDAELAELRALCDDSGLVLVEDCAQSLGAAIDGSGARVGSIGDLATFSFNGKAQLPLGEGGMVCSSSEELAAKVRSLRSHGMTSVTWDRHRGHAAGYDVVEIGFNYRLDEPRAGLGLSRLARLDDDIAARQECARGYRRRLDGIDAITSLRSMDAESHSSPYGYVVMFRDRAARDRVRAELAEQNIETTWYPLLPRLTEYRSFGDPAAVPHADAFAGNHCVLPVGAWMTDELLDVVVDALVASLEATD